MVATSEAITSRGSLAAPLAGAIERKRVIPHSARHTLRNSEVEHVGDAQQFITGKTGQGS